MQSLRAIGQAWIAGKKNSTSTQCYKPWESRTTVVSRAAFEGLEKSQG